jgi:membrane protein
MASTFRNVLETLKEAGNDFLDDHATKLSASLAYYTIFSIGPLLLVLITLLGFFYRKTDVTIQVFDQVSEVIGTAGAAELQSILSNLSIENNTTVFGVVGIVVFIFGATGIFTEIQSSINYIWSVKAKPKRSWVKYLLDRLLSFVLIIGMGLLLLMSLLLNLLMDMISARLQQLKHLPRFLSEVDIVFWKGVNIGILFVIVTFLFTVIYKVLPDAKIHLKDAMVGACFTGVLFLAGKFLITYYFGVSKALNAYGAAASIILLLSWVYYSSIILYFGAEFTKVYAMKWGSGITVSETAVYIIKREAKELPDLKHPVQEN